MPLRIPDAMARRCRWDCRGENIAVTLTKVAIHLIDRSGQRACSIMAKIDAERIEHIDEDRGIVIRRIAPPSALLPPCENNSRRSSQRETVIGGVRFVAVVAVVETEEIEAVARKQPVLPGDPVNLINVEQHVKHAIA